MPLLILVRQNTCQLTSPTESKRHSVEALYAQNANPVTTLLALEGVRALSTALPEIKSNPSSASARSLALYGAYLCGTCLGTASMSLHHKLCHTLGGSFNLPHAETHTIVLPHALAYNLPALPRETIEKLANALPGSDGDPVKGLNILLTKLGVERGLKAYGMKEGDVEKAANIAVGNPYWNPRPIEKAKIQEVIRRAWAGEEAKTDL